MLKILVPKKELFNDNTSEFITIDETWLTLEHSLVSVSKWESKWHMPYLNNDPNKPKTREQIIDYIRCMTITPNVNPYVYKALTPKNIEDINNYIQNPMTATIINNYKKKQKQKKKVITAEIIYYWMIALNIPQEYQKWHLNKLLTLIDVCQIENSGDSNKMNYHDTINHYKSVNAARRKAAKAKKK